MPIYDYLTCRMSIYRNVVWFTKGKANKRIYSELDNSKNSF